MRRAALLALGAATVSAATPAGAQLFVDGFAGRSMPQRTDIRVQTDSARVNGTIVPATVTARIERVRPGNSTVYGVRAGYWFNRWIGAAADLSTLNPDLPAQRTRATASVRIDERVFGDEIVLEQGSALPVSLPRVTVPTTATAAALVMVRAPVGAGEPARRVTPYAFAGPVWLVTASDLSGDLGVRAGGGIRVPVAGRVGVFGEYRFTHVNADAVAGRVGGNVARVNADTGDIGVGLRLRDHAAMFGLSLAFR